MANVGKIASKCKLVVVPHSFMSRNDVAAFVFCFNCDFRIYVL